MYLVDPGDAIARTAALATRVQSRDLTLGMLQNQIEYQETFLFNDADNVPMARSLRSGPRGNIEEDLPERVSGNHRGIRQSRQRRTPRWMKRPICLDMLVQGAGQSDDQESSA